MDNLKYEKEIYEKGYNLIGGIDEVGRGPLIGPVVAACVILPPDFYVEGLTDSKKISEKKRNEYYKIIQDKALSIGVGVVDNKVIDEINILQATKKAMLEAIDKGNVKPEYILIDGNQRINTDIPQLTVVKGDSLSLSIAAASIIAKVTRDEMMYELDKEYPNYEFAKHKGYPTKSHIENVKKYGILNNYRFTFKPICDLINNAEGEKIEKEMF